MAAAVAPSMANTAPPGGAQATGKQQGAYTFQQKPQGIGKGGRGLYRDPSAPAPKSMNIHHDRRVVKGIYSYGTGGGSCTHNRTHATTHRQHVCGAGPSPQRADGAADGGKGKRAAEEAHRRRPQAPQAGGAEAVADAGARGGPPPHGHPDRAVLGGTHRRRRGVDGRDADGPNARPTAHAEVRAREERPRRGVSDRRRRPVRLRLRGAAHSGGHGWEDDGAGHA